MTAEHSTHQAIPPGGSEDVAVNNSNGKDRPAGPHGTLEPTAAPHAWPSADRLIGIREIRQIFGLGRTSAYDLTHRPGFPAPVPFSPRCYRWWASEVAAFAAALRAESQNAPRISRRRAQQRTLPEGATPLRITGKVRSARSRRTPR